jgi:hypothetical protein
MAEATEVDQHKGSNEPNGVDKWNAVVLTITMIAVIIYAGLTYCLLKTTQAQVIYSQRAWLGLSDKGITTTQPIFADGELRIDIGYEVENYSNSTASKEFDGGVAIIPPTQQVTPEITTTDVNSPCGSEEQRKDQSGMLTDTGDAIFPHAKMGRIIHSHVPVPPGVAAVTNFWATLCIVYRDQTGGVRHSRLLYRSNFKNGDKPIQNGLLTYMPIANWVLWNTDVN